MKPIQFVGYGLLLIFVTLKLIDKIAWPWWQVLIPLWGPLALGYSLIGIGKALTWRTLRSMSPEERARHKAQQALRQLFKGIKP